MSKKINVGLDIGIASVGWSIVDTNTLDIIKAGSVLFEEVGSEKSAADTRMARSARRMLRRSILRKSDLLKLFVKFGFIKVKEDFYKIENNYDFLDLRSNALTEKISVNELMLLLMNYLKHRGTFNLVDDLLENNKTEDINVDQLNSVERNNYPVDLQKNWKEKYGKYRSLEVDEQTLISNEMYKKEINAVFDSQIQFGICDENLRAEYLKIFERKRNYSDGPGLANRFKNEKSKYGWDGDEDFFDRLTGKDTYDKSQPRAVKDTLTSYIFNLLNDLNNISINGKRIADSKFKHNMVDMAVQGKNGKTQNVKLKQIAKYFGVEPSEISGYRIKGKNNDEDFTEFKIINDLRNLLVKNNLDYSWLKIENWDNIDEICSILTKYQVYENRKEKLKSLGFNFLSDDIIKVIAMKKASGTHSLSIKTMKKAIPVMFEETKNHMEVFSEINLKPDYKIKSFKMNNLKSIPLFRKTISEMYISPVVKRAMIEAIKIIKEVELEFSNKMGMEIQSIVIEMAREKNSEEAKKFIAEMQKSNRATARRVMEKYGSPKSVINAKTREKLILLEEQDGVSIYSGREIDPDVVVGNPDAFQIDHIIPISISLDDSRSNKVLVTREENRNKGQCTPYGYLNETQFQQMKIRALSMLERLTKQGKTKYAFKKYNNLITEININDPEVIKGFIGRNLSDTRYATVEVKNYILNFKNELDRKWNVLTINGSFTNYLRKKVFTNLEQKNRDWYKHHAVDATLIALAPLIKLNKSETVTDRLNIFKDDSVSISNESEEGFGELNSRFSEISQKINKYDFSFTKKTLGRTNREISNATIYSLKLDEKDNKWKKVCSIDIFKDDDKLNKIFAENPKYEAFMKMSDKATFDYLKNIYDTYFIGMKVTIADKETKIKNPFVYFRDVLGNRIEKQSNEVKSPLIRKIKYLENSVANPIEITHKYKTIKKSKRVILESVNAIAWDVWQNDRTNKIAILPIDARLMKFGNIKNANDIDKAIRQKEYYSEKKKFKIDEGYTFKFRLQKNDEINIFHSECDYFSHLITGYTGGLLEIKPIDHRIDINNGVDKKDRIRLSVGKIKKIQKITSNILKTKFNIIETNK